jgi:peptidoglycan-associated lipoprotein
MENDGLLGSARHAAALGRSTLEVLMSHVIRSLVVVTLLVGCRSQGVRVDNLSTDHQTVGRDVVAAPPTRAEDLRALAENFQRVHFDIDQAALGAGAKAALDANAAILQRHPDVKVEVQGHADERGTVDYNLALGARRAESVLSYLRSKGVASRQLASVSYGEELPLQRGAGESVWAENRRAEFRVLTGTPGIEGTVSLR